MRELSHAEIAMVGGAINPRHVDIIAGAIVVSVIAAAVASETVRAGLVTLGTGFMMALTMFVMIM